MDEKIIDTGIEELTKGFWEKIFSLQRVTDPQEQAELYAKYNEAWELINEIETKVEEAKNLLNAKYVKPDDYDKKIMAGAKRHKTNLNL
jgi:hypothetical protein